MASRLDRAECVRGLRRYGPWRSDVAASKKMMERTTSTTVVFRHPFMLGLGDGPFPAGCYVVETDEELIPELSFLAYRRTRTTMTVPVGLGGSSARQTLTIDPKDLERALARDATTATGPAC